MKLPPLKFLRFPRRLRCAGLALGLLGLLPAHAAEPVKKEFDVPAGDAPAQLKQFIAQSGEQVVYLVSAVRGVRTQPVAGHLTAREALRQMLAGTELSAVQDEKTGALTVVRAATTASGELPPAPPPTAPRAAAAPLAGEPVLTLNPFEVKADADDSYGALQSNSLTTFRMDLQKAPITAQVFTQAFMQDVAATSIQEVLVNYSGVVGADPNNAGAAVNNMPGDRDGSGGGLGIRGLSAGAPKRDGLTGLKTSSRTATGITDSFSVERIELIEGPQALLYGAVGGGGVVNSVSKRAEFDRKKGMVQYRLDQYGSKRAVFDYNYGLGKVALRVAGLASENRSLRFNLLDQRDGLYGQIAFRLGKDATLRLYHEYTTTHGNVTFNPSTGNMNNFFFQKDAAGAILKNAAGIPLVNATDPRRGKDTRFLALTGQLEDLSGVLWDGVVDYEHISSFASRWSSENIKNNYSGLTFETKLPWGLALQLTGYYSETTDNRITIGKNLLPAKGYTGSGLNPFDQTAIQVTSPGLNYQTDRSRGGRLSLAHDVTFALRGLPVHSQTSFGVEADRQFPAFGSSGIDKLYYRADADWNVTINPAITLDGGRIPLGSIFFPVSREIPSKPLFTPASERITIDGQNYVLQPRIQQDPARVSPSNPLGLVPNNPTATNPNGFSGNFNKGGETHSRQAWIANFTEWGEDGRLTTLAGVSLTRFDTLNTGPNNVTILPKRNYWGWQVGANYALRPWLRAYATFSQAGQTGGTTKNFLGEPLAVPKAQSFTPEIGLKLQTTDGKYSAQLAHNFTTEVQNETRNAGADLFNAVNPNGINGRFNSGDQWINLDRKSDSTELVLTAQPVRNWRLRFTAVKLGGNVTSTVKFNQLYNDEFHVNASGVVTFANGVPLLVDPAGGLGPKTTPLTLAMINDPVGRFFANPDVDSGRITNGTLITALTTVDPANGRAATGRTGLPLSAIQYNFNNVQGGEITVINDGEKNTGINEYTVNLQSNYTFDRGWLKGFGVFTAVRAFYNNQAFYTSVFPTAATGRATQATRVLHRLPTAAVTDVAFSYKRKLGPKFGNVVWSTQVNINNVFDHSKVDILPSVANAAVLNARLTNNPRVYVWTNTFSF